jgi:cytochrome P450
MNDGPLEAFRPFPYMPADAAVVTDYDELAEILRSPKMRPEPPVDNDAVIGGTLSKLFGRDHTDRRRILNRLVKPDALETYLDRVLMPSLISSLTKLHALPDADGAYRTDLVSFVRSPFAQLAAAMAGFDPVDSDEVQELMQLVSAMGDHLEARFFLGDHGPLIERGVAAQARFKEAYFAPALASCPFQPGSTVPADRRDMMSLLAVEADPHWHDKELAAREAFADIFAAGVGASTVTMTNAIHELSTWLPAHPEAAPKLADLTFLSAVLQETIRLHPEPPAFGRVALEDVVLSSGREIKAGQWVAAFAGAANRDPRVFGHDSDSFNPERSVAPGTPRYGLGFGGGSHQCLGLRVVLGTDGVGSHAHMLGRLLEAGVIPDPERKPILELSARMIWAYYPVVFTRLDAVLV